MNILVCYAYDGWTTGCYIEKALAKDHNVSYCGPPYKFERAGFPANIDLSALKGDWDLFLYIDTWKPCFPLGIEKLPFPTACYLIDVQNPERRLAITPFFDYVFVAHKNYIDPFHKIHKNVFWLPLAADLDTFKKHQTEKIYEVGFVGGTKGREKILAHISRHFIMNDYKRFYPLEEISWIYSQSKIVFNKQPDYCIAMRDFEALSCGSLLLTERSKNGLDELFKDGKHMVTYGPKDNLREIINYYLSNDEARERIAEAGHKLVREKHTYWHRAQNILEIIKQTGHKRCAPMRSKSKARIFIGYEKVYSQYIMVDSACELFAHTIASPIYKLKALYYILKTVLKRLRQMGWGNLIKRWEK